MKRIAVRGDKNRGDEVLNFFKSLGGVNQFEYMPTFGYDPNFFYYMNTNKLIRAVEAFDIDLDEFDIYTIDKLENITWKTELN